jgi:hypothetical protein
MQMVLITGVAVCMFWGAKLMLADQENNSPPIAVINGESVDVREFQLLASAKRANVFTYFKQKYGVVNNLEFWQKEVQGEKPSDKLKGLTLERLKAIKVQQTWAKQEGLSQDMSYSYFLEQLHTENTARKKAIQQNQVIYGPQQYDEAGYYEYLFSNLVEQLKNHLAASTYKPDVKQLQDYYDANRSKYVEKANSRVQVLYISSRDVQAKSRLETAQQLVHNRMPLEEVVHELKADPAQVQYGEYVIGDKSDETGIGERVKAIADRLSVGQTSASEEVENGWVIVTCLEHKEEQNQPLATIQAVVISDYVNALYQKEVSSRIQKVTVQFNDKIFNKLTF